MVTKKEKRKNFMFDKFFVGLEASRAWILFVGGSEDVRHMTVFGSQQIFFVIKILNLDPNPDPD